MSLLNIVSRCFIVGLLSVTSLFAGSKPSSHGSKPAHVRKSKAKRGAARHSAAAHKTPKTIRRTPAAKPSHTASTHSSKKTTGSEPSAAPDKTAAPAAQ
jgi:hypothetical protein